MNQSNPPPGGVDLAERLRHVHVGVRPELEVSRHVFRGEPAYIVTDPITFQSHRLTPAEYEVLAALESERSLDETFQGLIERGSLEKTDEQDFYSFIFMLHRFAFLNLPISDDKTLYRRFEARRAARLKQKAMGFLYLRVPLVNPDHFLTKTVGRVRFLFSRFFFVGWLGLMAVCAAVAAMRWHDLIEPLNGVLAAENLLLFWGLFVGLKLVHEMGHAYACKHFGGHVPEMGVFLIALTPCAYVDASASWGFSRVRERLIVSLAGMYIESIVAGVSLLVWSVTAPSLIHDLAYQACFMASVVTVAFNVNPLMKFDGYYILTDLIGMPNLRQQSVAFVRGVFKRIALGIKSPDAPRSFSTRVILFSYGVASSVYKVFVVFAIAGLIATKLFLVGMALAAAYAGTLAFRLVQSATRYLWWSPDTVAVRPRAIAVSVLLILVVPLGIAAVPLPVKVTTPGVVTTEAERVLRAGTPGFVKRVHVQPGDRVAAGGVLVEMVNPDLDSAVAQAAAQVETSELRIQAHEAGESPKASQEISRLSYFQRQYEHSRSELAKLSVTAPRGGFVAQCLKPSDVDRFLQTGDPVATVSGGRWVVRCLLTADEFTAAKPEVGQAVQCRSSVDPSLRLAGSVVKIAGSGQREIDIPELTHLAGGRIPINPRTHEAAEPYFEITIAFEPGEIPALRKGMTAYARFDGTSQSIGVQLVRRLLWFRNHLLAG